MALPPALTNNNKVDRNTFPTVPVINKVLAPEFNALETTVNSIITEVGAGEFHGLVGGASPAVAPTGGVRLKAGAAGLEQSFSGGAYAPVGGSSFVWGDIAGVLTNQTDLVNFVNPLFSHVSDSVRHVSAGQIGMSVFTYSTGAEDYSLESMFTHGYATLAISAYSETGLSVTGSFSGPYNEDTLVTLVIMNVGSAYIDILSESILLRQGALRLRQNDSITTVWNGTVYVETGRCVYSS